MARLIGGKEEGDDLFYERMVPQTDRIYDAHLEALRSEQPPPSGTPGKS